MYKNKKYIIVTIIDENRTKNKWNSLEDSPGWGFLTQQYQGENGGGAWVNGMARKCKWWMCTHRKINMANVLEEESRSLGEEYVIYVQ